MAQKIPEKVLEPRPVFQMTADRKKLEKRCYEAGYKPENGYGDDWIDEMIEIFTPWLKERQRSKKRNTVRSVSRSAARDSHGGWSRC